MNEPRSYASLSSGLLARKGAAKPAMRPQSYGGFEDLGWNDMGYGRNDAPAFDAPEHVPSSIAALTPAPRGGRAIAGDGVEGFPSFDPAAGREYDPLETEPGSAPGFDPQPFETAACEGEPSEAEAVKGEAPAPEPTRQAAAEAEPVPEAAPSVVAQQRAILERFDGEEEAEAAPTPPARSRSAAKAQVVSLPKRKAAMVPGRKAAFTLRLDAERHLRLRLACAVSGRSAQQILIEALDEALAAIPEIEALAARVPATGAKRN